MSINWNDAFRGSLLYCVYACMWAILGGIVMGGGFLIAAMIGYGAFQGGGAEEAMLAITIFLIVYFVGIAICALGSAASMIKVAGDTALKSTIQRREPYDSRRY